MLQWAAGGIVWRKVLRDHPNLVVLFAPGKALSPWGGVVELLHLDSELTPVHRLIMTSARPSLCSRSANGTMRRRRACSGLNGTAGRRRTARPLLSGRRASGVVWRRINNISEPCHIPAALCSSPHCLAGCFASSGNEEMLAAARRQHPKLEQAITNFGNPPQALLNEFINGTSC